MQGSSIGGGLAGLSLWIATAGHSTCYLLAVMAKSWPLWMFPGLKLGSEDIGRGETLAGSRKTGPKSKFRGPCRGYVVLKWAPPDSLVIAQRHLKAARAQLCVRKRILERSSFVCVYRGIVCTEKRKLILRRSVL